MTKRQMRQALEAHKARKSAEQASQHIMSKVVAGYPYSHNPYVKHEPVADCFAGCVHS
jgi:hypothetical protein